MKKSRFSEEQIIAVLKEHLAGIGVQSCAASTGSAMRPSTAERLEKPQRDLRPWSS